ncbi:MAG TPA: Stp1/IreP family PP2C-type Ser/Thr phosphatase [Chthonomonadaceae bacterium]|nr:Stp1/IreP family PP2C-type Ser/Thr phosphatase [Chthonomonadaceae bacterium]
MSAYDAAVGGNGSNSEQETTAKFDRAELVRGWREYEARQPRVVPVLKYAAKTDMGQVRENNEDKFDYYEPEHPAILAARGSLFAVADGIGGAQAGQIASEMMLKQLIASYYDSPAPNPENALYDAISQANDRIYHLAQMIPERNGMGTTLIGAIFIEDEVLIAQVGDSRAYLIRDGVVTQVSVDHSWVEESVRAGLMTREAAETSPFRNVITRSVGAAASVEPDFYREAVRPGDIWVLCSDGLTGYVSDDEIRTIAGSHPPAEAARQFIELANARGGRDNITVFVLSVRDLFPYSNEAVAEGVAGAAPSAAIPVNGLPAQERPRSLWGKLFGK